VDLKGENEKKKSEKRDKKAKSRGGKVYGGETAVPVRGLGREKKQQKTGGPERYRLLLKKGTTSTGMAGLRKTPNGGL